MTSKRAMVLISDDPISRESGSREIFNQFQIKLQEQGLENQVVLSTIADIHPCEALPLLVVYPDAIVYGPIKIEDIDRLIQSHLIEGQLLSDFNSVPPISIRSAVLASITKRHLAC